MAVGFFFCFSFFFTRPFFLHLYFLFSFPQKNPKTELSKSDLLRLLGYLEGELQARDVVIATLKVFFRRILHLGIELEIALQSHPDGVEIYPKLGNLSYSIFTKTLPKLGSILTRIYPERNLE